MSRPRLIIRAQRLDCLLFDAVARSRTSGLDYVLPLLSRTANHSLLWTAIASGMALIGGRVAKRAAVRGIASIAATSAIVNVAIKPVVRRPRPSLRRVPAARRLPVAPLTTSFPSGHAASAAAFTFGVATDSRRTGAALAPLAAAVAYSRIYVGVHYPLDVAVGAAVGAGVGALSRLQWPAVPAEARDVAAAARRVHVPTDPHGADVSVVVNRESGTGILPPRLDELRSALPRARILEIDSGRDLAETLRTALDGSRVLGILGGDGTVTAAAALAVERDRPLLILPGGTLNHLARDLRLRSPGHAVQALASGEAVEIDVAAIDGRPFLNTASFGAYTAMVDRRKALEKRIGRWPAHFVGLAGALTSAKPLDVTLDGRRRRLWMVFVGNCRHEPAGVAPSWRPRLDDGVLDVRLVLGEPPLARLRLVASLLTGRLTSSVAYERFETRHLHVRAGPGMRLARDGDTFDGSREFTIRKLERRLVVFAPHDPGE